MSHRVLVLDTDSAVAEALGMVLRQVGYGAHVFAKGEHVLDFARENRTDVAILAAVLPGSGTKGASLVVELLRVHPDCKVLLISARPDVADHVSAAVKQGFQFDLIAKPTRPMDLVTKIRLLAIPMRGDSAVVENRVCEFHSI